MKDSLKVYLLVCSLLLAPLSKTHIFMYPFNTDYADMHGDLCKSVLRQAVRMNPRERDDIYGGSVLLVGCLEAEVGLEKIQGVTCGQIISPIHAPSSPPKLTSSCLSIPHLPNAEPLIC